jgi:hypothetical protein
MVEICHGDDVVVAKFIEKCKNEPNRSVKSLLRDRGFGTVEGHLRDCKLCWNKVTDLILERRAAGNDVDVVIV